MADSSLYTLSSFHAYNKQINWIYWTKMLALHRWLLRPLKPPLEPMPELEFPSLYIITKCKSWWLLVIGFIKLLCTLIIRIFWLVIIILDALTLYITSTSFYLVDWPDGLWDSYGTDAEPSMGFRPSSSKVFLLWSSCSFVRHDGPQKQEFERVIVLFCLFQQYRKPMRMAITSWWIYLYIPNLNSVLIWIFCYLFLSQ
jgi:hypothetical protein